MHRYAKSVSYVGGDIRVGRWLCENGKEIDTSFYWNPRFFFYACAWVCVCVCVCVCVRVGALFYFLWRDLCVYVRVVGHACMDVCVCQAMYVWMWLCVYAYLYAHLCACMSVWQCLSMCFYIHVCVCVCVCFHKEILNTEICVHLSVRALSGSSKFADIVKREVCRGVGGSQNKYGADTWYADILIDWDEVSTAMSCCSVNRPQNMFYYTSCDPSSSLTSSSHRRFVLYWNEVFSTVE